MATMASHMTSGALPPSKSVARALQTAILQLCNEHVSYNSRLQIVGVLCLSIDDQEDELVVKINNTLKRMNSATEKSSTPVVNQYRSHQPAEPSKTALDQVPTSHDFSPSPRRQNGPTPQRANPPVPNMVPPPVTITKEPYPSAQTSLNSQSTLQKTTPSPHKGRKRSHPVKVHHVIDEGELMNSYGDDDHDDFEELVTVIPQAPETTSEAEASTCHSDTSLSQSLLPESLDFQEESGVASGSTNDGSVHGIIDVRSIQEFDEPAGVDLSRNGVDKSGNGSQGYDESMDYSDYDLNSCEEMSQNVAMSNVPRSISPIQIAPETSPNSKSSLQHILSSQSGASSNSVTLTNNAAFNNLGQLALKKGTVALIPVNALNSKGAVSLLKPKPANASGGTSLSGSKATSRIREMLLKGPGASGVSAISPQKERREKTSSPSPKKSSPSRRHDRLRDLLKPEEIKQYFGKAEHPIGVNLACKVDHCSGPEFKDLDDYFGHTWMSHNCYVCHECGKVFMNKAGIMRHRPIHTGIKRFACNFCKADFHRMDKCKLHVSKHMKGADKGKPIIVGKHIKVLA